MCTAIRHVTTVCAQRFVSQHRLRSTLHDDTNGCAPHVVVLQGCNFFAAKVVANRGLTDNFSYDGRFVAAGSVTAGSVPLWLVLQCPHQQTYLARYSYSVKAKKVGSTILHVLHHTSFVIAWHCALHYSFITAATALYPCAMQLSYTKLNWRLVRSLCAGAICHKVQRDTRPAFNLPDTIDLRQMCLLLSPRVAPDHHSVVMQDAKFLGAYTPNAFIYASSKVRGASGLYAIGSRYSTGQVQPRRTPATPTTSSTPNAHLHTMLEGRAPS